MGTTIYFARYFDWYNTKINHRQIGYVTPEQKHRGLDKVVVAGRERTKVSAGEDKDENKQGKISEK